MLCVNPFRPRPGVEHGCGQCLSCRLNRRREWTARIALEAMTHPFTAYATLTYADQFLPPSGSLSDDHWREITKGIGFRYFGCGEYGEKFCRPHYHLLLFGLDPFKAEEYLSSRWPYGFVQVSPDSAGLHSMAYVASYVVKKMTNNRTEKQTEYLQGRRPEFARMSRRPAIGRPGLEFIIRWLPTPEGRRWMAEHRDVPNVVQIERRAYPLGRTLVGKLRELADIPSDDPVRREARESHMRLLNMDKLAVAERDRLRYGRYDVLKAKAERASRSRVL